MHVVATAGHVDHGKSTLVRALTGIEPDRWAEERRRRLTIDLGYAWSTLPSGDVVAFVDVPGHSRFIGNMLAGLGPVSSVLFVVAADEGWREQSTEHLAAIDALGLTSAVLVVTRSDRADPRPATAEALDHIGRTSLGRVDAVAVSGVTGAGIDKLRAALQRLVDAAPSPDTRSRVRLWVDRAFTIQGIGTVVTGTLAAGTLRAGDTVELRGREVRVRGLHSLETAYDEVRAVARVAVSLRGVERGEVARGDALLTPGAWALTSTIEASMDDLPSRQAVLHLGTAAVPVRLHRRGEGVTRLSLAQPLPLEVGDRGVLRDATGRIRGGVVVRDTAPSGRRERRAAASSVLTGTPAVPGVDALVARLSVQPFAAPERAELDSLGLGRLELDAAVAAGRLLRLPSVVVLLPDAPRRALELLSSLPQPFSPSAAREVWGTTRRVAIPLLEHLDGRGWTRRVDGTGRIVVR